MVSVVGWLGAVSEPEYVPTLSAPASAATWMPTGLGRPWPAAVTPTCRPLSVPGSVIGPFGPSTVSLTAIGCPGLTLGVAVMIARTAPCQNTVALTSWLARLGGAVSLTCQVPT